MENLTLCQLKALRRALLSSVNETKTVLISTYDELLKCNDKITELEDQKRQDEAVDNIYLATMHMK